MTGDLVEAFSGVIAFVAENDVHTYPVTFLEDLLELLMVGGSAFRDQAVDDLLGEQVDEDVDFLEVFFLFVMVKTDLDPCAFPVGFHSAGIHATQLGVAWEEQLIDFSENHGLEMSHGVLYRFITRCPLHTERLIDVQVFGRIGDTSVGQTKEDFEQEENDEMRELKFPPLDRSI